MKTVTLNQGSEPWKAWRRDGIGGSDVAGILGISPYTDPPHTRQTVFAEKVHGIERPANFSMHRGQRLEPHARRLYELRRRCTAPPVCVEMAGCPWARVSLDGLCSDGAVVNPIRWILELKAPAWETHDLALAGIVAEHFDVQCQWQMLVTDIQKLDFASFNPSKRFTPPSAPCFEEWVEMHPDARSPAPTDWLALVEVQPDAQKQAWILEEAARFWHEVLEARDAFDREAGLERLA